MSKRGAGSVLFNEVWRYREDKRGVAPCGIRGVRGCIGFGASVAYCRKRQEYCIVVTVGRPKQSAGVIEVWEWVGGVGVSNHPMV